MGHGRRDTHGRSGRDTAAALVCALRVPARYRAGGASTAPGGDVRLCPRRSSAAGGRVISVDISPTLATRGAACAGSSYVGIGITADPRTDRIILVGDDTPASRAGLRHDDFVLNPVVWRDAHVEGKLLRIEILREGYRLVVPVLVGKICVG
jgi:hypothetical protein